MGRQVAVTGAAGSLGRHVLELLARDPGIARVVALDIAPPPRTFPKTEFHARDVRDPEIGTVMAGCDAVLHLAFVVERARHGDASIRAINLDGTRNVCEAAVAAGVTQIVYASSIAVYGFHPDNAGRVLDETAPRRGNPDFYYTRDKAAVEEWLDAFEGDHPEVRVARLRPSVFLGERSPRTRELFFRTRWIPVARGPRTPIQITHEEDVADAFLLALHQRAHGAYNLATQEPLALDEILSLLGKRVFPVPNSLRHLHALAYRLGLVDLHPMWLRLGQGLELVVSAERARRELGWAPRYPTTAKAVSRLAEGLRGGSSGSNGREAGTSGGQSTLDTDGAPPVG